MTEQVQPESRFAKLAEAIVNVAFDINDESYAGYGANLLALYVNQTIAALEAAFPPQPTPTKIVAKKAAKKDLDPYGELQPGHEYLDELGVEKYTDDDFDRAKLLLPGRLRCLVADHEMKLAAAKKERDEARAKLPTMAKLDMAIKQWLTPGGAENLITCLVKQLGVEDWP